MRGRGRCSPPQHFSLSPTPTSTSVRSERTRAVCTLRAPPRAWPRGCPVLGRARPDQWLPLQGPGVGAAHGCGVPQPSQKRRGPCPSGLDGRAGGNPNPACPPPRRLLGGAALQQQRQRGQRARLGLPLQRRHGEDPAGRPARVRAEQLQELPLRQVGAGGCRWVWAREPARGRHCPVPQP